LACIPHFFIEYYYRACLLHLCSFNHPNELQWRIQIVKLLSYTFSPFLLHHLSSVWAVWAHAMFGSVLFITNIRVWASSSIAFSIFSFEHAVNLLPSVCSLLFV
jgi:hypothetical protein